MQRSTATDRTGGRDHREQSGKHHLTANLIDYAMQWQEWWDTGGGELQSRPPTRSRSAQHHTNAALRGHCMVSARYHGGEAYARSKLLCSALGNVRCSTDYAAASCVARDSSSPSSHDLQGRHDSTSHGICLVIRDGRTINGAAEDESSTSSLQPSLSSDGSAPLKPEPPCLGLAWVSWRELVWHLHRADQAK